MALEPMSPPCTLLLFLALTDDVPVLDSLLVVVNPIVIEIASEREKQRGDGTRAGPGCRAGLAARYGAVRASRGRCARR